MRVVLGIGGGIAAYKSAELARVLQQAGHTVQVVMTRAACEFITPLTLAALTGKKVITGLFTGQGASETLASAVEHIGVAQENDLLVVAPATADLMAKFSCGIADDFLTTLYLAFTGKVVLAPAMNSAMWQHPATQTNLEVLRARGTVIVDPDEGWLACGTTGPGRIADPAEIAARIEALPQTNDLSGKTILITAGPTQEAIDAVRFLSNRSSGRMGYALAEAAAQRGANVVLVSGPVSLPTPAGVRIVKIRSAAEMRDAVLREFEGADIIIKAAAVADYYLADPAEQKVKKTGEPVILRFEPTPDILAELGRIKGDRILVGFAAETQNLLEEARRKLTAKNCDYIVANLVSDSAVGFDSKENEVTILSRSGETVPIGRASKEIIAAKILDYVCSNRSNDQRRSSPGA